MTRNYWTQKDSLLRFLVYGSVVSTYILILIGGYVTTSNSGAACGSSPGTESWPLCNGGLLPNFNDPAQMIEFSHRIFNFVVVFFILGTAILAWTRYRPQRSILLFSTGAFIGLFAQIVLGMVTVTTDLNPAVSDAHLGLAVAVFALIVVNAVMVWKLRFGRVELSQ
jgi:cytochrome c oxidase assembly protein subunit 15